MIDYRTEAAARRFPGTGTGRKEAISAGCVANSGTAIVSETSRRNKTICWGGFAPPTRESVDGVMTNLNFMRTF